jgi:predicted ATPase
MLERIEAMGEICSEYGFAFYPLGGNLLRGWALAEHGQVEEGIAQIRQSLAAIRATGMESILPYWLLLLAEALGKGGQAEEGLKVVAEALTIVDRNGERLWGAEIYRLKGELTLQQFSVVSSQLSVPSPQPLIPNTQVEVEQEAEEYFLKAIEVAYRQSAKSWELRAVMSLARLWQQQGKRKEAHKMLREIYDWFTEGFDTADLKDAKTLLETLKR